MNTNTTHPSVNPSFHSHLSSLTTPDTSYLTENEVFNSVYDPAEDTFLLLDALELEIQNGVLPTLKPTIIVEIGSGSGCVSTFLTMHLPKCAVSITTDINFIANVATLTTSKVNKILLERKAGRERLYIFKIKRIQA
ncbi:S-adenosylmethionine-dependent methyltransferase [Coelomomyces lativittatus]|nr:S-adenosylmethionine-dependent methyltransferase [Coelomomyces lativittatus]